MDKIISEMQKFDFSKMEASVYTILVRYSKLNGSQVAKLLKVSRASVYSALNSLYEKGVVYLLPDDSKSNMYKAEPPKILFTKLRDDYLKSAELLEEEFSSFEDVVPEEQYWNIKGYNNFVIKAKQLLYMAEEEIYISTNLNLEEFKEEIKESESTGVKIHVFTNSELKVESSAIEKFEVSEPESSDTKKISIVIDNKTTLIASGKTNSQFLGTFTDNPFLVEIVSEYIHSEIYMVKLLEKFGDDVIKTLDPNEQKEEKMLDRMKIFIHNRAKLKKQI